MQVTIELADNEVVVRIGIPPGSAPTVVQQVARSASVAKNGRKRKEQKYQAGDRVRVVSYASRYGVPVGWEGTVKKLAAAGPLGWSYEVKWDQDGKLAKISESTIERVVQ